MPNLKDIKRKIASTKGTQKTTNAMKLVSSSKLKKAEEFAKNSKIYASKLTSFIQEIAQTMDEINGNEIDNIFFKKHKEVKVVSIVFITADKGLCGGFNYQTIKKVDELIDNFKKDNIKVSLNAIGKKGISYYKFNKINLTNEIINLSSAPDYKKSSEFIDEIIKDFIDKKIDKVIFIYNGYKNMITQELKVKQLLPIDSADLGISKDYCSLSSIELEPDEENLILDKLVKKYIEYSIYYGLIDSLAAEHSSRMQAMDTATKNAKDMVKSLSIKYNKARQEAITTELIEIISGIQ